MEMEFEPYPTLSEMHEKRMSALETIDINKIRRRIEDRLRKDQAAVIRVAELLKIKVD